MDNHSLEKKKVFVGLSGGVDSSVAAFLLQKEGYEVIGVHIRGYNLDGCGDIDAEYARRSAEVLNIPFYVWDMEDAYKDKVVNYLISSYEAGITPNPDVMCNKEIKFGLFLEKAIDLGAHYVATGHYAKIDTFSNQKNICIPADKNKDQTYFLWTLSPYKIQKSLFPLGDLTKDEVRKIAQSINLPTANKKDSQGICFLGDISMRDFLKQYIPTHRGPILDEGGNTIGHHDGLAFYTIGQRHLGVPLISNKENGPRSQAHYVIGKDLANNALVVAEGDNNPSLFKSSVYLRDVNFCISDVPKASMEVMAKVRYRQALFPALLENKDGQWLLTFNEPQKFVADGQSAVFYSISHTMLGGGIIV